MIIGFSLDHMEAEKTAPPSSGVNVNFTHAIEDVQTAEIPTFDDPVARITFSLDIVYQQEEEDIGSLGFGGALLWQKDADAVIEKWDEDKALDEAVATAVANRIYRKCLTHAVGIADSLELPPPVPMPRIGQKN